MERLKLIFRSAKLSTGRKESVADHSWRLSLMVSVLAPKLQKKINIEKALKMAIIHDIDEINDGDIPSHIHFFNKEVAQRKKENGLAAMKGIKKIYQGFGEDIYKIWEEYEEQKTFESKFVKALDRLDARIQIIDDPKTAKYPLNRIKKVPKITAKTDELCSIDPILIELNHLSKKERQDKYGF